MAKSTHRILVLFLLGFCALSGCKPDDEPEPTIDVTPGLVYLVNEGNFQWGNASMATYDPDTKEFVDELFKKSNGYPIGDVFQSIVRHKGSFLLALNNSGKIVKIDTTTLKVVKEYAGFQSPRYILPLDDQVVLVTDLYSNFVSVLNLESGSVTKKISLTGWSEQMLRVNDEVWIGNRQNDKVYVVDVASLELTDSLTLAHQINSLRQDATGALWIICQGDEAKKLRGALFRIDPLKKEVLDSFQFELKQNPFNLRMNPNADTLYFINQHIFKMPVAASQLPSTSFIELPDKTPYGLDIDPSSGLLYFSDAIDYVSRSEVSVFEPGNGDLIHSFKAGVLCNHFLFPKKK